MDLLPTLVDLAGGPAPADLDGRSFVPVLRGKTTDHRDRLFTTHSADGKMNHYPMRSIRTRDWKLILNLTPDAKYTTHIDLAPRETKPGNWGTYWESWKSAAASDPAAAAKINRYHHRPAVELYDPEQRPARTAKPRRGPRPDRPRAGPAGGTGDLATHPRRAALKMRPPERAVGTGPFNRRHPRPSR